VHRCYSPNISNRVSAILSENHVSVSDGDDGYSPSCCLVTYLNKESDDEHPLACGSSSTRTPYALSALQMGRRGNMLCVRYIGDRSLYIV
ncbi:hypothetical protein L195_g034897, partial [Trifolium pratense]